MCNTNNKAYLSAQPFPECSCSFSVQLHSVKAVGTWQWAPAAEMLDINLRGQTERLCVPALLTDCYIPLSSALAKTKGSQLGRSLSLSPPASHIHSGLCLLLKFRHKQISSITSNASLTVKQSMGNFTVTWFALWMHVISLTTVEVDMTILGQPRADSCMVRRLLVGMTGM